MRRSFAPSQQLRSLVTKRPKLSSYGDTGKENEDFVNSVDPANTLKETLKSIRKSSVSGNEGEVANETSISSPRNTPLLDSHSALHSTRMRNELIDKDSNNNKIISVDKTECKPKFVPPKRFISPLIAGQTKDTCNNTSHSGDADSSIASRYYSVVW